MQMLKQAREHFFFHDTVQRAKILIWKNNNEKTKDLIHFRGKTQNRTKLNKKL